MKSKRQFLSNPLEKRSSGLLLHISSLPSPHGVGDLGKKAIEFLDFLQKADQTWWQMVPLGPTGASHSPYQAISAFAGNPLFIDLESLRNDGLLNHSDLEGFPLPKTGKTEYHQAWQFKKERLRKAFSTFEFQKKGEHDAFEKFCVSQAFWLDDFALFCALKGKHRGAAWTEWESPYRHRHSNSLKNAMRTLEFSVRYHQFLQYKFFTQWRKFKKASAERGVSLIGDVPIFVSHDSADVWAHQDLFWLDASGKPSSVAGCPPDYFSSTGQRWGNPLYRWEQMKATHYKWWIQRFNVLFELVDAARLDHFIGFYNYWRIPAQHRTAENGSWIKGPGEGFFKEVFKRCGRLPLIAEDLGAVTPEVSALRDKLKIPGMRVLQFAFDGNHSNPYLPHNHVVNSVVYTGTHDNDTTVGWFEKLKTDEKERVLNYLQTDGHEIHWKMITLGLSSVANLSVFPVQDLLGLESHARLNTPGTTYGNWTWRLDPRALTPHLAKRLAKLTRVYHRGRVQ